jgi:L-ribulose-5-phosphate 3-epimerase UlaE
MSINEVEAALPRLPQVMSRETFVEIIDAVATRATCVFSAFSAHNPFPFSRLLRLKSNSTSPRLTLTPPPLHCISSHRITSGPI